MREILPEEWTLPAIDARNEAFFCSGRLLVRRCTGCGLVQHPPEDVCAGCQGVDFDLCESAGRGRVHSYTVAHHPAHPDLAEHVPYAVVLVELDDHPHVRIVGNLLGVPPETVRIGRAVRAIWEAVEDENGRLLKLPQWALAD